MDALERWYENFTFEEAVGGLEDELRNIKKGYVAAGFYMKYIKNNKLYEEAGYRNIWEFAETKYGISKSTASRWMAINDKFSKDGNSPFLKEQFEQFEKSQLQEMLYLDDKQMEKVTPDMTTKEIREIRKPAVVEEVSILGHPLRVYPEGSLIASHGCGKQDCFSCHRDGCNLRQEDCRCVEATCGNPFSCTTLKVVDALREEIGSKCQFVNEDLAFHRAGDGQPVPCCKKCNNPCGYECRRSSDQRYKKKIEEEKENYSVNTESEELVAVPQQEEIPGQMNVYDYPELIPENAQQETKCNEDEVKRADTILTFLVEAVIDEYDIEDMLEHLSEESKNNELQVELLNETVIFEFCNTKMIGEFLTEIEIYKNGVLFKKYTWQEFFEEFDYVTSLNERSNQESVIEEFYEETSDLSDIELLKEMLNEENKMLKDMMECCTDREEIVRKQKIKITALASLLCNLDTENPKETIEQRKPEFPVLKNNDQRKKFLENYQTWPKWFEVPEASEIYYKFDLPDESSIVVCDYCCYLEWKKKYGENPETTYHKEYLLTPGYKYLHDCGVNQTTLIEHLKNIQKGER